ncbi:MAG: hypothetical protein MZV70_73790 [Desulfobacterales bacterium]|nr:hypothetical protein [Desulfobacterales bacterium]
MTPPPVIIKGFLAVLSISKTLAIFLGAGLYDSFMISDLDIGGIIIRLTPPLHFWANQPEQGPGLPERAI